MASCRQSPQPRPEGAKRAIHGICPGELFVLQQCVEIPASEQRCESGGRFAEPLASVHNCPAHDVRGYPVIGGLCLSGAAFAGKVSQVIFIALRTPLVRTHFIDGQEGAEDIGY